MGRSKSNMDERLKNKVGAGATAIVQCSRGHKNTSTASYCWVCGEFLQGSPKNVQKKQIQHVPYERVDGQVSAVQQEMEKIRIFCDDKKHSVSLWKCHQGCICSCCQNEGEICRRKAEVKERLIAMGQKADFD
jgi:hypothetical protein